MTACHDCTGFQRDCLVAIAAHGDGREPYGLALKTWLDERYGEPINHSRLYQNLDRLERDGLVTKHELDARTNAYQLTDAGRDAVGDAAATLASATDREALFADGGDHV